HGEPVQALRLVDIDVPEPGPGQVRLKVLAAGLGLPDVFMCRGHYPLTPPLPFTPGQEVAGVVTAVGPDVAVPVGQRVMTVTSFTTGDGGYAAETPAWAAGLSGIPDGMGGADVGVDHRSDDVRGTIMAATDGRGADLVFDPVGGDVGNAAMAAIARKGRFLLIGYASGSWVELSPLDMCMRTYSVVGVLPTLAADSGGAMQRDLARLATGGSIKPPTTTAVPFDDLPAALQAVADRTA